MVCMMIRSVQRVFRAGNKLPLQRYPAAITMSFTCSVPGSGRSIILHRCPIPSLRHRALHCSRYLGKELVGGEFEATEHERSETEGSLNEAYTDEQRDAILDILNMASESELASIKLLRGKKAASIVLYREQHGPFLDLDSLVNVPNFKHKISIKVCDSILNPRETVQKPERRPENRNAARFLKPDITEDRLEAIESIVSIVFGIRKIAWAHVDRKMTVLDWQQEEWYRFMKGAYQPHVYLEDISQVVSKLPKAEFYVLEKPAIFFQNSSLFPVTLHLRTVEAMLYALLNIQYSVDGNHRVLSMVRNSVGKYFELMIGESRTSGIEIVKQLLTESVTQGQPRISFPRDMVFHYRNQFQSRGQNRNEEMCDALLQAIAFYELVVV